MVLVHFQQNIVLKINLNVLYSLATIEKKLKFLSELYLARIYSTAEERRSIILKSCLLVNSVTCTGKTPIPNFHPVTRL